MARKILLADDSVTAQNMGRRILSDAGYEVITVNNGSAALKKIAEAVPDIIVLDVYMPGYGGLEVCQRLKESQMTSRIPVLLTVGKLEPFKVEEARRVRADAHIVKPFDPTELLAAIMRLEDKIVPQAASLKPGRFSRNSGTEATSSRKGRDKSIDPGTETSMGWKRRLSIPRRAPTPEEPAAQEGNKTVSTGFQDFDRSKEQKRVGLPETTPEVGDDKTAVASSEGVSDAARPFENFTVERIMAMEASSPAVDARLSNDDIEARLKAVVAESEGTESNLADIVSREVTAEQVPPAPTEAKIESPVFSDTAMLGGVTVEESPTVELPTSEAITIPREDPVKTEAPRHQTSPSEDEVMAALASLSPLGEVATAGADGKLSPNPVGASISATVFTGPRWIAEPIPLSDGDSHLILETEMEKAYAAFATYENATKSAGAIESGQYSNLTSVAMMGSMEGGAFAPESQPAPPLLDAQESKAVAEIAETTKSEPLKPVPRAEIELSVPAEVAAASMVPQMEVVESAQTEREPIGPADEMGSLGFREIAYAAAASAGAQNFEIPRRDLTSFPVDPPGDVVNAAPETANVEFTDLVSPARADEEAQSEVIEVEPAAHVATDHEREERESQLAAAWQNWRQIRETIVGSQLTSQITDAAAAGFKQIRGEGDPQGNPKEAEGASYRAAADASIISGIVDSVFAELKPKLMEEIAKKLAQHRE